MSPADADKALVSEFEAFCKDHRDEIDALQVLYERPYARRLTRKQLMDLVATLQRPPRQWTGETLWAAYERIEKDRVRGASRGRLLTDLISLARHAMGVDPDLVSYADQAAARFDNWLAQQQNRGRRFTELRPGARRTPSVLRSKASASSIGNDRTSVGPRWPMCSRLRSASSASSVRTTVTEPGAGAPQATSPRSTWRAMAARASGASTPARRTMSTRHGPR